MPIAEPTWTNYYNGLKQFNMDKHDAIIDKIFKAQREDGFWEVLLPNHKYYPDYLHYVPNFRATLWTLILLADLGHFSGDPRVKRPLKEILKHFFDKKHGIFCLGKNHFPIPCLNGNMIYIDCYFNGSPGKESRSALEFFRKYQRFDDGSYVDDKNEYCKNTSCYGKHSCYWGITKLMKGISFIPKELRTAETNELLSRCIQFVLLHEVCYSSHNKSTVLTKHIDKLTFPNMYKSDFLELLWLLKRENVTSHKLGSAINLLKLKQLPTGEWNLERKINNIASSIGGVNKPNHYISKRAEEVLKFYDLTLY